MFFTNYGNYSGRKKFKAYHRGTRASFCDAMSPAYGRPQILSEKARWDAVIEGCLQAGLVSNSRDAGGRDLLCTTQKLLIQLK